MVFKIYIVVCKRWQHLSRQSWQDVKVLRPKCILDHCDGRPSVENMISAVKRCTPSLTSLELGDFKYTHKAGIDDMCKIIGEWMLRCSINIPHHCFHQF